MTSSIENLVTDQDISSLAEIENLAFDGARSEILRITRTIDVQACPGSGKTTLIAAKLMLLAQKWPLSHQGICVLSHTNVAKNELIERLKHSNVAEARRLLSYPHFIGTIQEFVHRYIAMPYLRSLGVSDITVDNEEYARMAKVVLARGQFARLSGMLKGLGDEDSLTGFLKLTHRYLSDEGEKINISRMPRAWKKPEGLESGRRELQRLKLEMDKLGLFLFRDMYTFASLICQSNAQLPNTIAKRFPLVFIDEMQDTQVHQDDILRVVFPLDKTGIFVNRFGDPDQAIFHGTGKEAPNESFNSKSVDEMDFVIHKSHRFDDSIAALIGGLSYNSVPLETELSEDLLVERMAANSRGGKFRHSIITFDDQTRDEVIGKFSDLVSDEFIEEYKRSTNFVVKVVGAVGNEIDPTKTQLKIGHYWPDYDKSHSKSNFQESTLLEAVRYCRNSSSVDWSVNYNLLLGCIIKLLRMCELRDAENRYYSVVTLKSYLQERRKWKNFRETIALYLENHTQFNEEKWRLCCELLDNIFGWGDLPGEAIQYLEFSELEEKGNPVDSEEEAEGTPLAALSGNRIKHCSGFYVDLATIHSVKGESHDATLILQTKNYSYDIRAMLSHLTGERPNVDAPNSKLKLKPTNVADVFKMANRQFLRQLYVAASRSRHLLCMAIHEDHISDKQRGRLMDIGWQII